MKTSTLYFLVFCAGLLKTTEPTDESFTGDKLYAEIRGYIMKLLTTKNFRFKKHETKCEDRYNEERTKTFYCHCDINCELYGDCCYDYWKNNVNKTIQNTTRDITLTCSSDVYRNQSSLYWYPKAINIPRIRGHMATSTCANDATDLVSNCSNPAPNNTLGKIPVETADNETYKNIYCAFCNGHIAQNITFWRYEILCPLTKICDNKTVPRLSRCLGDNDVNCTVQDKVCLYDKCTWYFAPPQTVSKTHTICSPVATCPRIPIINVTAAKYRELTSKCEVYMLIVYHQRVYYKNFHCAICHGVQPTDLETVPADVDFPTLSIFFDTPRPIFKRKVIILNNNNNQTNNTNGTFPGNVTMSSFSKTKSVPGERYLTVVGFILSMVSLIVLLILYSMVKALRTTPGKIIIGLSVSLLSYQVVLLVSPSLTDKAVACSVLAIILHLTILSAFAWMAVMSFDVWKTFGKKSNLSVVKSKSTFRFYCLYVAIEPLLIVVTAVILDQNDVLTVYWRKDDIDSSTPCWILDSLSHLVFFLIPIGLTLAFNIVALLWTVYGITKVKMETRRLNEQAHKETTNNLKMYGKLSVVMGLSWVLGFVIEYSDTIRYLYVIINSSQGFLIFLAFVVNRRVVEKYKQSRKTPTNSKNRTGWTSGPKSNGTETRNKNLSPNTPSTS